MVKGVGLVFWRERIKCDCSSLGVRHISDCVGFDWCGDVCKECNLNNCWKVHDEKYISQLRVETLASHGSGKFVKSPPPKSLKLPPEHNEDMENEVKRLVMPVFESFFSGKNKTPMVGGLGGCKPISFLWRPNNYRLRIPFFVENFCLTPHLTPHDEISSHDYKIVTKNSGVQHTVVGLNGNTVTVYTPKDKRKKPSLVVMFSNLTVVDRDRWGKAWFLVRAGSVGDVWVRIQERVQDIFDKCLASAMLFCKLFGGRIDVSGAYWSNHEDEVHGDWFIDSIPSYLVVHDTYFKKVYDKGVEFNSPVGVKNYISNRVVEEIAPEIAGEINKLNRSVEGIVKANEQFYNQFGSVVTGNVTVMQTLVSVNKGLLDLRRDFEVLRKGSSKPRVRVRKVNSVQKCLFDF